jgi:hypothetical protein
MDKREFNTNLDHTTLMKESYFNWLLDKVCDNDKYSFDKFVSHYKRLLKELYSVEFVSIISNDDNRIMDGIALRDKFVYDMCIENYDYFDEPCSFLEMLVALAIRCEKDIMVQTTDYDRTATWFWLMLDNCGLSNYTDRNFNIDKVYNILDRVIYRTYFRDGTGGLFRISNFNVIEEAGNEPDLRKMELWYQLSFWLQENYYLIDDDRASENILLG